MVGWQCTESRDTFVVKRGHFTTFCQLKGHSRGHIITFYQGASKKVLSQLFSLFLNIREPGLVSKSSTFKNALQYKVQKYYHQFILQLAGASRYVKYVFKG